MADFFLLTVGFRDGKLGALGVNRVWVGERLDFFYFFGFSRACFFLGDREIRGPNHRYLSTRDS